jgi:citrate lyase subunit beta / citryl-CoA lyase
LTIRSLLFIPGNKENMLAKASSCRPDVLVPDMEDSVPDGEKATARAMIADWLGRLASHTALLMPRVNSLQTEWFENDLAAVVGPGVWGISIGKIDTPADISQVSGTLARFERQAGLAIGSLRLIPWIESALAIVNCYEICRASNRIAAIAFGGEDFTADMGIERLDNESNLIHVRATICTAARAAGVSALDTPFFQFRDDEGLKASCIAGKQLGFKGRFAIHPAQIDTINACFVPSEAEIEQARRIVSAFEDAERRGRGSTSLDGRVIDIPVVKRARDLLNQAN